MASTLPTASEMLAMSFSGQENAVPAAEERAQEQTHTFLSLAPATSASYPVQKPTVAAAKKESKQVETEEALALATPVVPGEKTRRSSSLSSDGSLVQKRRFLRLGPVHFGVGEGDWSEEVVE